MIWLLILLAGCSAKDDQSAPRNLMPEDVGAWKKKGEAKLFEGADLYGHINGGAEVFLELGFDRLDVQAYSNGKKKISVETYWMTDRAAALGIYLMKCGKETRDSSFQERHTVNEYQLFFQRGSVYVTINSPSGEAEPAKALIPFGQRVAERIPWGDAPNQRTDGARDLFASLPEEGRITGTERVIRGAFTLQGVYTLGTGDILLLDGRVTALAADYAGDGKNAHRFTRILADYPDKSAAAAAFANVKNDLDPGFELISSDDSIVVFKDYSGRFGKIELCGSRLDMKLALPTDPGRSLPTDPGR